MFKHVQRIQVIDDVLWSDSISIIEAELEEELVDGELQEKAEVGLEDEVADGKQVSCEADGEQAISETDSFEAQHDINSIILNEQITSSFASEQSMKAVQPSDFIDESIPYTADTVMPKETESNDQSSHANHANSILWSH